MARRATLAVLCALAMMAGAFRFTAAPGPGLDPDALSYLSAARSLATDGTLRLAVGHWRSDSASQPLAHFPPGYATVLAVPVAFGMDVVQGARLVQAIAAGVTGAAFVVTLWPVAGAWGAALGAVALALMPAVVFVHLSVLSEPLFLALLMVLLWSLVRHPRAALLHGVIAATTTMVRYAGLSAAGAAALWALRDRQATWRERFTRAATAVVPSLLAMAAWSLTRARAPGQAQPIRKFALYGDWGPTLREGARTVAHHLAPTLEWEPVPRLAAAGTLVALVALVWSTVRTEGEVYPLPEHDDPRWPQQRAMLQAAGCLAVAYVALVAASRLLADPAIPLDFRLIAPLALLAVVAVTIVAARAWRVISTPARVFGALALAVWMVMAVRANHQQVTDALADGGDFAGSVWRDSPTLAWVRAQDPQRVLFTNVPWEIWFNIDRPAHDVPDTIDITDAATMRAFAARLRDTRGAMVAWNWQNPEMANTDSIVARAGLVRVAAFADGNVYEAPPLAAPESASAAMRAPAAGARGAVARPAPPR